MCPRSDPDQARRQASLTARSQPPGQPPLRQQPHTQPRLRTCTRRSAILVLEEDGDGGGGAAVHVRVPAPGHVFHEAHVAGAKHVPGSVTSALSLCNYRIQSAQFHAGVIGRKLPMGFGVPLVPFAVPCLHLFDQGGLCRDTAPQALPTQMAEFDLRHV